MLIRRFILCFALLMGCFQPAAATPSCDGVDNVLQTVSILRDIQSDTSFRQYSQNIPVLKNTVAQISLPALQPASYREAFPEEDRALFLHVSALRRAVESAQAGYDDVAQEILNTTNPALIADSLLTLNRYWGCTNNDAANTLASPMEGESVVKAGRSLPSTGSESATPSTFSSSETLSNEKANTRTLAKSISNGPKLDIQGHPFLSIAMALSLIVLIYGWRKYSKRSRARDHRHLIHQETKFKIGKHYYQMTVIDITQKGLKFKHDGYLGKRAKLSLELDGAWHSCRLQWKNANFAGAKFKYPLKDKTMDALLAAAHQEGLGAPTRTSGAS
ncbi:hypothetical protein [Litorimonas haliclonae]|uniref:hypothetical protein n=1 Tax=Litorimonas haliclonae TaxID=2081977 RepID=UPI0039EE1B4E